MTAPEASRRVFISYTGVEPIVQLSKAIQARGYFPFSSYDLPATGSPHLKALLGALEETHFALFVVAGERQALNASVELGIALAAGLPVAILASPETELPDIATSLPVVRTSLNDAEGLEHALTALEELPVESVDERPRESKILGEHTDQLLNSWTELSAASGEVKQHDRWQRGAAAEEILAKTFRHLGIQAIQEPRGQFSEADFVVWDADLEPFVGSPLLVEVVGGRWSAPRFELKIRQLGEYLGQLPSARWALVVLALDSPDPLLRSAVAAKQRILTISMQELLERMRTESFADVVRTLRNERIHS